jgi:hypothetical protein
MRLSLGANEQHEKVYIVKELNHFKNPMVDDIKLVFPPYNLFRMYTGIIIKSMMVMNHDMRH